MLESPRTKAIARATAVSAVPLTAESAREMENGAVGVPSSYWRLVFRTADTAVARSVP